MRLRQSVEEWIYVSLRLVRLLHNQCHDSGERWGGRGGPSDHVQGLVGSSVPVHTTASRADQVAIVIGGGTQRQIGYIALAVGGNARARCHDGLVKSVLTPPPVAAREPSVTVSFQTISGM